jgi:hypothetical protein
MGSTRKRMAGVAAVALSAGLFAHPVLAQQGGGHSQREGVANSKAGQQTLPLNNLAGGGQSGSTAGVAAVEAEAAPTASRPAPSPAAPGGGGGSGSSSAPAPEVTAPAAAPVGAAATPGLSQDAPEIAPSLGVVGGRGGSSSPSPAATPEPSTLLLMGTGLVGLYRLRKRQ